MADITLTAAVRSNLSTLQSTANLISDTQERLATGKKVNSALDNPNSFFTASSLNSRASDLSNLQDDIGQSVSTLEASDKGIQGIDKLLDAAKGKANQALQSKDADTRAKYAAEFNELRTQIEDIAKDSGYKGKNLLGGDGNDLLVKFNEDGSSKLNIGAVDYTDLDSENSSITLGKIGTTVGEVDESDGKRAFNLSISADDILSAADGTGTGNSSPALTDGTDAPTGTEEINSATAFANGGTITVGGEDAVTIAAGLTTDQAAAAIQEEVRKQAGNEAAEVTYSAGEFQFAKVGADVELDYTAAGVETGFGVGGNTIAGVGNTDAGEVLLSEVPGFGVDDTISIKEKDGATVELQIGTGTKLSDLTALIDGVDGLTSSFDAASGKLTIDNTTKGDNAKEFSVDYAGSENGGDFGDTSKQTIEADVDAIAGRGWGSDELIEDSLDQVRQAQLDLRAQASTFGTNLSIVTNRQDFTADLISTLEVGAGKLTLADSNLEGANLAALNTQNSIATSTLSLATQAGQSVLQLIR
ncbi:MULTISPECIES: hypothetical protein [unclassified Pseudovibrio]|uniref:flagellin N-terminal helical domain-containing protein n=1 Tax=unclassified Pseudovibrio TaxID=2627060 RepID=UPI0007AEAE47|nr:MULTISPECIES: hypothetical protein [unclassified Pseudovibrio]KZK93192.1 Flagellin [Pseudovibrio sp. W74]KZL07083.1 Flagellin [Pseudovibrio sp. Ad14]